MMIHVKFFAGLREALGVSADTVIIPGDSGSAGDVLAALRARGGAWVEALAEERGFRVAVDQCMATTASAIRHGSEVAFFPPVTGG
jgi:molybdopterin synthase sulfur carrier subunit